MLTTEDKDYIKSVIVPLDQKINALAEAVSDGFNLQERNMDRRFAEVHKKLDQLSAEKVSYPVFERLEKKVARLEQKLA